MAWLLLLPLLAVVGSSLAQESAVHYHVREQQSELTYIGNVARDSKLYGNVTPDEFSRMKFQILSQGNQFAPLFVIDGNASTLKTNAILDREDLCAFQTECVLTFNVAVYLEDKSTGVLDLYKIIKILVTIDDINDNSPQFPHNEITIPITENSNVGAEYFTNGAIDHDTGGNNSVQSYIMDPPNEMFGLKVLHNSDGSSDLNLVVKYPLDRESRSFYQLIIYAVDGGTPVRTGSVKINITITDQNDNAPVFTEKEYSVTVAENVAVNSTILIVTATDSDAWDNGDVTYRFSSSTQTKITDMFALNSSTGEITSRDVLDYERQTRWSFKVEALDGGIPPRTTPVMVHINIADSNDNYPQINVNSPPGGNIIKESDNPGTFVAHVAVYDLDEGEVTCKVLGNDFRLEDFKIKDNYKVVLNNRLDHEVIDSYDITIQCEDSGKPTKTNTTTFTVKVEDVNDNAPEFEQQTYVVTVQEEVLQTMIEQVSAKDKDSGSNGHVTYKLRPQDEARFTVNSRSGLITANSRFDREEAPFIQFDVLAFDGGDPSLTSTATVIINITDINDNAPKFPSNPLNIYLNESDGSQIVNLNVSDPDAGMNGQFSLEFPNNDYLNAYFTFDTSTGEIKTKKPIDREEIPYFKFWVKAVDSGIPQQSSSTEVILHIRDSNDNIPAIMYPNNSNNTKNVPVTAPVGLVIATVEAFDKDDGVNAQLLYFIDKGDTRDIFRMDVNTGQIRIGREMEQRDADTYKLDIAVRDNGEVQRTSWAKLKVVIEPSNDTSIMMAQEETKQNILIVAIFVAVTGALSIAIVATIFIIRYIDRRGRQQPAPKLPENRFYDAAKVDESLSGSSSVSKDSDAELLKKRAKKEVSFSLDESSDAGNNSTLTNVTSFSTTKLMPSYMSMEYKPEDSQSSTWLCNNTLSSDLNKTDIYSEKELSALTTSQLQHAIHQLHGNQDSRVWLKPVPEEQSKGYMGHHQKKFASADDNHSETSHETSTSDSGRGGSEEDIHSNRGHTLSDSEEGSRINYAMDNRRCMPPNNKFVPRRPPPPVPEDSYQRNISFSDDSVNANMTVVSCDKKHRVASPLSSTASSMYKTPLKQTELFFISGRTGGETFLDSQMTTPGLPYSIADIDMEEMSEMATTCRDDASTTTSGSYTINPDELCNEIDDLFFRDVIV